MNALKATRFFIPELFISETVQNWYSIFKFSQGKTVSWSKIS